MTAKKAQKELYLKIPYHILNLQGIGLSEKVLLAHIYSFGVKGCWQSNATLAEIFMTSPCTVSRWVANIRKFILIRNPKGYYRTLWAKSHPDVPQVVPPTNKGKKIHKQEGKHPVHCSKNAEHPTQKCASEFSKSAIGLTQKCATTNNITIKETIRDTTATPSPLPAGGQASALLTERKEQNVAMLEQFKKTFGFGPEGRNSPQLTQEQFQQRRQSQINALMGTKEVRR